MSTRTPDYGQAPSYMGEIPRYVSYTSPVSIAGARDGISASSAARLPLNLLALIIDCLDDVGDLARVTRTSRLLYYLTLPVLYQRVSLHSYGDIRYVNGRPEGFGGGSPLMMALNGLVTKSHAALVKEFRIWGQWKEVGLEEFRMGRVPDNSMMLNILLRACVDKMSKLQSFTWALDTKPLKTLYQGLAARDTLASLTIRFSSSRVPRPSVLVPPMANLRALKIEEYDPLCYPDDLSLLILQSRRLEDLRLHFSPRMRREAEPSLSLGTFFGRCAKAGYRPKLKHFALQNFIGANLDGIEHSYHPDTCQSVTMFDTFGGAGNSTPSAATVFLDSMWNDMSHDMSPHFRCMRGNEVNEKFTEMLKTFSGLERLYLVSGRDQPSAQQGTPESSQLSPRAQTVTPVGSPTGSDDMKLLGRQYLHTLSHYHGQSLKHLLLPRDWAWNAEEMGTLIRFCPNLEQVGFALNTSNQAILRLLLPFLVKLKAFRLLHNHHLSESMRMVSHEDRMSAIGAELPRVGSAACSLRWIGMGSTVYRVDGDCDVEMEDGTFEIRREITMVPREEVRNVEIWRLDTLDLDADPSLPLNPP
ncbi:hypothetical protein KC315_g15653 [Hortaea werneckii]|nr:hypothetical protein KC315_g15653 [Hortaea werneckii]